MHMIINMVESQLWVYGALYQPNVHIFQSSWHLFGSNANLYKEGKRKIQQNIKALIFIKRNQHFPYFIEKSSYEQKKKKSAAISCVVKQNGNQQQICKESRFTFPWLRISCVNGYCFSTKRLFIPTKLSKWTSLICWAYFLFVLNANARISVFTAIISFFILPIQK